MSSNPDQIARRLGRAVRKLREEAGWSQIDLAEKADLNFNFVGKIERGDSLASVVTIVKLAKAFGLTAADILRRSSL